MEQPTKINLGRRGFSRWVLTVTLGLGVGSFAGGLLMYLYPPGLRKRLRMPVEVPEAHTLPAGGSVTLQIEGETALFLKTGHGYRVFLLACTHLGCIVRWRPQTVQPESQQPQGEDKHSGQFVCPCHGGVFDAQGKVVSGPPRRPLTPLLIEERDGRVFIV